VKKGDSPAGGDLVGEILHVLERDEHNDGGRMSLGESPGGFEAIHLGHVDVHQDEIRAFVIGVSERLCAGCGISHRLEPSRRIYHGSGDPAKRRLVIDDHDSDTGPSVCLHSDLQDACNLPSLVARDNRTGRSLGGADAPVQSMRTRCEGDGGRGIVAAMALRIVVAEDNLLVREGLVRLLSTAPDIEVVASCDDYDAMLAAVEERQPDVVVTDIRMPPTMSDEGIRLAQELRSRRPEVGVVVVSQYSEASHVVKLFEGGSDRRAYLLKERLHDRAVLVSAVRGVAAGGTSVDARIIDILVYARSGAPSSRLSELTSRESEVLAEIAQGRSNAAIAESLYVSKRSVEKLVNSVFLKLDLGNAEDVSKRVKAALIFLGDSQGICTH
jgi:DNA-binding NarL/FixJ family response regulator